MVDSTKRYFGHVRRDFPEIYFETYLPTKRSLLSEALGKSNKSEKYIASRHYNGVVLDQFLRIVVMIILSNFE